MNIKNCIFILLFACSNVACSSAVDLALNSKQQSHKIVPLRTLFANTNTKIEYKLSPDSSKLAWIAIEGTKPKLHIKDMLTGVIHVVKHSITTDYFWADDNKYIIFSFYHQATKSAALAGIDTLNLNKEPFRLLPQIEGHLQFQRYIYGDNISLLLKNVRDDKSIRFVSIDLLSEAWSSVENIGENVIDIIVSNGKAIARVNKSEKLTQIELYDENSNTFNVISNCHFEDVDIELLSVDSDGYLNYISNCESDTLQLTRAKSEVDKLTFCQTAGLCTFDVGQVIVHPVTGVPQFIIQNDPYPQIINLSKFDYKGAFDLYTTGILNVTSISQDLAKIVISYSSSIGVSHSYLDFSGNKTYVLSKPQLEKYKEFFITPEFVNIAKYSGVEKHELDNGITKEDTVLNLSPLYGYYYPSQILIKDKTPTVVLLHGGPFERSYSGYDKDAVFLSNRGYNVLSLNYRGSKGFGRKYQESGYANTIGMLEDIQWSKDWLYSEKNIEHDSIAVMGSSYGGYLSLLASKAPNFACTISINGIYDLKDTASNWPSKYEQNLFIQYFGSMKSIKLGEYDNYSPIEYSEYKNSKILMVHSQNDERISIDTANMFYNKNKDDNEITYLVLDDNHSISKWYSRIETYRDVEIFLNDCIGGINGGFDYYQLGIPFLKD